MIRISAKTTPVPEAVRILKIRHGYSAPTVARQNADRTESATTRRFWLAVAAQATALDPSLSPP